MLDNYHVIQTVDFQVAMARLVQHMPAHFHLVLTTRADPPLPLERLRGRQQLLEIRSADLRFTTEEARHLLQQMLGSAAADETAALLEESTEGWAVGLQLAAISMRGRSDPVAFARRIARSRHPFAADYLLAEVLEGLPQAQRACLLQTSLLDRFCVPLCDAVRGEASQELTGEDFVRALRRSNLFLAPLDDEGTWYRYHHLFQHLLRNRLRQHYADTEIGDLVFHSMGELPTAIGYGRMQPSCETLQAAARSWSPGRKRNPIMRKWPGSVSLPMEKPSLCTTAIHYFMQGGLFDG